MTPPTPSLTEYFTDMALQFGVPLGMVAEFVVLGCPPSDWNKKFEVRSIGDCYLRTAEDLTTAKSGTFARDSDLIALI